MPADLRTLLAGISAREPRAVARAISLVENNAPETDALLAGLAEDKIDNAIILGITGPPGAGKSTLTGRLISHYRGQNKRVGIIAIDPTSPISGGALLGDRVRMMDHALDPDVTIRSMATRGRLGGLCAAAGGTARIMAASGCSHIVIETVGVGQSEMDVIRLADITALVLAPGLGDEIQAMKAGLLEVADILVVNKADCTGADALAMDLETAVRTRTENADSTTVCRTVAINNEGTAELAESIARVDARHRQSGERQARRVRSFELEVLDWAVDLLKPQLRAAITAEDNEWRTGDPKRRATQILAGLGIAATDG